MSPDEQEAGSRRYGNDIIMLLPLKSGRIAVFNNARELCGYVMPPDEWSTVHPIWFWEEILAAWKPPSTKPPEPRNKVDLEELGLI